MCPSGQVNSSKPHVPPEFKLWSHLVNNIECVLILNVFSLLNSVSVLNSNLRIWFGEEGVPVYTPLHLSSSIPSLQCLVPSQRFLESTHPFMFLEGQVSWFVEHLHPFSSDLSKHWGSPSHLWSISIQWPLSQANSFFLHLKAEKYQMKYIYHTYFGWLATDRPTGRPSEPPTERPTDRPTNYLTDWPTS